MNASSVNESTPVTQELKLGLQDPKWRYPFEPNGLQCDWNRDGFPPTTTLTQAPVNMGSGLQNCGAFTGGEQKILLGSVAGVGQPDLTRVHSPTMGDFLAIFDTTGSGRIDARSAQLGDTSDSSCTGGDKGTDDDCLTFESRQQMVPVSEGALGVSVLWHSGYLFLAYTNRQMSSITVNIYEVPNYSLRFAKIDSFTKVINGTFCGMPELQYLWGTASTPAVMLAYCSTLTGLGAVYQKSIWISGSNWTSPSPTQNLGGMLYAGPGTPGSVAWPDPYYSLSSPWKRTCMLLPADFHVRFACYDPGLGTWEDFTEVSFPDAADPACRPDWAQTGTICAPQIHGRPEVVFVPLRTSNGLPLTPHEALGRLFFVFATPSSYDPNMFVPAVWVSEYLSATPGTYNPIGRQGDVSPLWREPGAARMVDHFSNVWANLAPGTTVAIYSDSVLGGAMGLAEFSVGEGSYRFYPHADGTPNEVYLPGNDFRIMEDGLCLSVSGNDTDLCGEPDYEE